MLLINCPYEYRYSYSTDKRKAQNSVRLITTYSCTSTILAPPVILTSTPLAISTPLTIAKPKIHTNTGIYHQYKSQQKPRQHGEKDIYPKEEQHVISRPGLSATIFTAKKLNFLGTKACITRHPSPPQKASSPQTQPRRKTKLFPSLCDRI